MLTQKWLNLSDRGYTEKRDFRLVKIKVGAKRKVGDELVGAYLGTSVIT